MQQGDAAGAQFLCREILRATPDDPEALYLLGVARVATGLPHDALESFQKAHAVAPHDGPILESLGLVHLMLGNAAAAEAPLRSAAALPGAPASVWMRLGYALIQLARPAEGVDVLREALVRDPGNADIHMNLGQGLAQIGDTAGARERFESALGVAPDHADSLFNLGALSMRESRYEEARRWFGRLLTVLAPGPAFSEAREALASADFALGRYREAADQLRAILDATPGQPNALIGLAEAQFQLGELDAATAAADEAIAAAPQSDAAYAVAADIRLIRGELAGGVRLLEAGYAKTQAVRLLASLRFEYRRQCDWPKWRTAWEALSPQLTTCVDAISPFSLMCETVDAQTLRVCAERWSAQRYPSAAPAFHPRAEQDHARLRIGYLSSDLHEHATAYLLAEVLELHDRQRCEIFAYSYGPEDGSPMRARLRAACEHFVDIGHEPDDVAAARIVDDRLDLLIDLKGHTLGARTGLLARRPCDLQVNWLGFPGTMGASFIDYVIADAMVIPPGTEANFTERVVRLPHCYQPNDRQRPMASPRTRSDYGLPAEGAVFCCFNQSYKISPEVFAVWLRLLARNSASVLWLLEDNPTATANLCSVATAAGVATERLIFAPRLPLPEHLARYRIANVALDTFPYTSHTTASDAIWAGCPLVALSGETFASRVSASILAASGLSELITSSFEQYEALAVRLIEDSAHAASIRIQVEAARTTSALFDTTSFTRDLENLYAQMRRDVGAHSTQPISLQL